MKVKIFKWANVVKHCKGNKKMMNAFQSFYDRLQYANWETPSDIKKTFGSADIVTCEHNRVIFNVGGNDYRLICGYSFTKK